MVLGLDLQLCPAALVHFASRVTTGETEYLSEEWLTHASNLAGANQEASQHRRGANRPKTGIRGKANLILIHILRIWYKRMLRSIDEERDSKRTLKCIG